MAYIRYMHCPLQKMYRCSLDKMAAFTETFPGNSSDVVMVFVIRWCAVRMGSEICFLS